MSSKKTLALVLAAAIVPVAVWAQDEGDDPFEQLQQQVVKLTLATKQLQNKVKTLEEANLITRLAVTESQAALAAGKLGKISLSPDGQQIYIDGANLHIRSGSGSTYGAINGLGNLIIGYDEGTSGYPYYEPSLSGPGAAGGSVKTGSHNVIIGEGHSYTSYGSLLQGVRNRALAPHTIAGSIESIAGVWATTVWGGYKNQARGNSATVIGGVFNVAKADFATVSGGQANTAEAHGASVSGGYANRAIGALSSVSGGEAGIAEGYASSVSGGYGNRATGQSASATGGHKNLAQGNFASALGGQNNQARGPSSVIVGGGLNIADPDSSVVVGGSWNRVEGAGVFGVVLGGAANAVRHLSGVVLGQSGKVTTVDEDLRPRLF